MVFIPFWRTNQNSFSLTSFEDQNWSTKNNKADKVYYKNILGTQYRHNENVLVIAITVITLEGNVFFTLLFIEMGSKDALNKCCSWV